MGRRFEFQIRGRALICLALWLLLVPLRWAAGAVLAAAIHELGHMTALWMWSVPVLGMEIDLTGAVIRTAPLTQREELCCALAGPLAGGCSVCSGGGFRRRRYAPGCRQRSI